MIKKYYGHLMAIIIGGCMAVPVWAQSSVTVLPEKELKGDSVKVQVPFGSLTKKELSSSLSSITSDDIIRNSVFSAGNALYGKLAGLYVIQGSGEPGNDAPTLLVRGRSTSASMEPLILVDGIERDLNAVLIEDIESVSVLKDASSTVVYGVRGANGVILVTTKRGSVNKLRVNARAEQNFLQPTRMPEFVSSADFVKFYNTALGNDGQAPLYTPEQIAGYEAGDSYFYPNVNWAKETIKDYTRSNRFNLDVSGGDNTARYFVSLGYNRVEGLYKNTNQNEGYSTNANLNNYFFRSNIDVNIRKNWSASLDLGGRIADRNSPNNATATIWEVIYKYPSHLYPVYVQDGVYGGTAVYANNPVGYINSMGFRKASSSLLNATLRSKYDFSDLVKGLKLGISYATDNFFQTQEGYQKQFAVRELLGQDATTGEPLLSPAIGRNTNLTPFGPGTDSQDRRNTFEGTLEYAPTLGADHNLNTILIYHQDKQVPDGQNPYSFQYISGKGYYGFKQKYFAEIGFSYSGTEAFAKGHRFGFFPALSAAWILSEEGFLRNDSHINLLKLRASAGRVGNSALLERFSYINQYRSGTSYVFGNTNAGQGSLRPGIVGSNDFTWETASKYDVGIDMTVFDKLSLALTGFYERRTNILNPESNLVPGIFGGALPNINSGVIDNKGLEAMVLYRQQKTDWGYNVGFNLSYAKSNIVAQAQVAQPYDYLYRQGNQVNQPFILEAVGFFSSVEDIANSPVQTYGPINPGDIKYKDQNNDGRIDDFDRVPIMDNGLANLDLGIQLGFNIKNFSVNAFFQGQFGRDIYLGDSPYLFWPFYSTGARISTYNTDFWTEQTQGSATYPRLSLAGNANNYRPSSFWYVNGDFLRLRSLDFAYDIPASTMAKAKIKGCKLFLRGMNLFTMDHLKFADPESRNGYPSMRSYTVGLNVQF